ncbi:TPA: hypothetical protein ACX6NV_000545 [Photobacterium damselae]
MNEPMSLKRFLQECTLACLKNRNAFPDDQKRQQFIMEYDRINSEAAKVQEVLKEDNKLTKENLAKTFGLPLELFDDDEFYLGLIAHINDMVDTLTNPLTSDVMAQQFKALANIPKKTADEPQEDLTTSNEGEKQETQPAEEKTAKRGRPKKEA